MRLDRLPQRIAGRIRREVSSTAQIWRKSRELAGDPDYDLGRVDEGFADRREPPADDSEILTRICVAYGKAKAIQKDASPVYRPSNEWLPVYEAPLKPVMAALSSHDLPSLRRMYGNFWRDPCSTGLLGWPLDMQTAFFGRRISRRHRMLMLNDVIHRHRLWRSLLGNTHGVKDLEAPAIGNPFGFFVDGTFLNCGCDYQHYYATLIGRLLRTESTPCVVELGGGFGGMAYYLIRDNPGAAYVDLDLPENAALTAYHLLKAFPGRRIRLFGEAGSIEASIRDREIQILPSFEAGNLPDQCAGVAFNSYSLAEMSRETITSFIQDISRVVHPKGYFLHVNHNKNSLVTADEFGVDPARFDLLYKVPAMWNLGINPRMDEFEYLYKKRASAA